MKKIIILLLIIAPIVTFGQRIKNLTTESTYSPTLWIPVDKSTYSVHHKISLQTIQQAISDSITYNLNTWEAGSGTGSIQHVTYGTAIGSASVAANNGIADGDGSFAHGQKSVSYLRTSRAFASDVAVTSREGSAQFIEVVVQNNTSGADPDTLWIDIKPNNDSLRIPVDAVMNWHVELVGVQYAGAGGTVGDAYTQNFWGAIKNDAGTTALIGAVDTTTRRCSAGANSWTVAITADNTNDMLAIVVTGDATTMVHWVAYVRWTMVGFRNFNLGY